MLITSKSRGAAAEEKHAAPSCVKWQQFNVNLMLDEQVSSCSTFTTNFTPNLRLEIDCLARFLLQGKLHAFL